MNYLLLFKQVCYTLAIAHALFWLIITATEGQPEYFFSSRHSITSIRLVPPGTGWLPSKSAQVMKLFITIAALALTPVAATAQNTLDLDGFEPDAYGMGAHADQYGRLIRFNNNGHKIQNQQYMGHTLKPRAGDLQIGNER
jgi:hypothetical protein